MGLSKVHPRAQGPRGVKLAGPLGAHQCRFSSSSAFLLYFGKMPSKTSLLSITSADTSKIVAIEDET